MVGARTVPNAGRAGEAVLGVAALRDAAAALEGGVIGVFHTGATPLCYSGFAASHSRLRQGDALWRPVVSLDQVPQIGALGPPVLLQHRPPIELGHVTEAENGHRAAAFRHAQQLPQAVRIKQ